MDFDSLTIIMGDFNEVRADTQRLGTTFCHQGAINFNDFISSSGLFDLPLYGLRPLPHQNLLANSLSFKEKLQGLKLSLKVWRKQVSASENSHVSAIRSLLLDFDTKAEAGTLTPFDIDQRSKLLKELHDLEYKNIKDLRQKAKSKWPLEGDENSSFFYGIINSR
ncbi:hypothetical protein Tco_1268109 [Tanacetum coccineum]